MVENHCGTTIYSLTNTLCQKRSLFFLILHLSIHQSNINVRNTLSILNNIRVKQNHICRHNISSAQRNYIAYLQFRPKNVLNFVIKLIHRLYLLLRVISPILFCNLIISNNTDNRQSQTRPRRAVAPPFASLIPLIQFKSLSFITP